MGILFEEISKNTEAKRILKEYKAQIEKYPDKNTHDIGFEGLSNDMKKRIFEWAHVFKLNLTLGYENFEFLKEDIDKFCPNNKLKQEDRDTWSVWVYDDKIHKDVRKNHIIVTKMNYKLHKFFLIIMKTNII